MKHGKILFIDLLFCLLCGCGHSVLVDRESTGVAVFVPCGDGAIGVCIGNMKCSTAQLRGGASVETTSTSSGGIFSGAGGVSKITNFKTNAQLNEGNLVKVMTSPEVPDAAKVALATNLAAAAKAPKFMPSIMQTEASTIHLGSEAIQSNAVEQIERRSSGIDKIIETVPQITTPIVSTVTDVVDDTAGKIIDGTTHLVDRTFDWAITVKWFGIISALCVVAIAWLKGKKKDDKEDDMDDDVDTITAPLKQTKKVKSSKTKKTTPVTPSTPSPSEVPEDPQIEEMNVEAVVNSGVEESDEEQEEETPKKKSLWSKILYVFAILFGLAAKMPDETKKKIAHSTVDWMKKKQQEKQEKKAAESEETK